MTVSKHNNAIATNLIVLRLKGCILNVFTKNKYRNVLANVTVMAVAIAEPVIP